MSLTAEAIVSSFFCAGNRRTKHAAYICDVPSPPSITRCTTSHFVMVENHPYPVRGSMEYMRSYYYEVLTGQKSLTGRHDGSSIVWGQIMAPGHKFRAGELERQYKYLSEWRNLGVDCVW
ncbi:hypothetical protein N7488_002196 [Penicillium malachiteum]|nr:hypothetical protein N7488_002196 [Penicillium malachiteum]